MKADIRVPAWAVSLISDHTDMIRNPHPLDAAKVGRFALELPDDAYFEYAFLDASGSVRADPENPVRGENPWYPEVSAFVGPSYQPDAYAALDKAFDRGTTTRHRLQSRALGALRRFTVYTPAGFEAASLPVVLVQDGVAYQRVAGLQRVLEALLDRGEVRPAHLVFIEPADRTVEYGFNPDYRAFITDELLPFVAAHHPCSEECLLLGASLGGLVSATLALEHPELFGTVLCQSGAFLGTPEEREFYRTRESWLLETLEGHVRLPLRWYLEVGAFEWLLDVNREIHRVLLDKGYDHAYVERPAGHNWVNWRNGLASALRFGLAAS